MKATPPLPFASLIINNSGLSQLLHLSLAPRDKDTHFPAINNGDNDRFSAALMGLSLFLKASSASRRRRSRVAPITTSPLSSNALPDNMPVMPITISCEDLKQPIQPTTNATTYSPFGQKRASNDNASKQSLESVESAVLVEGGNGKKRTISGFAGKVKRVMTNSFRLFSTPKSGDGTSSKHMSRVDSATMVEKTSTVNQPVFELPVAHEAMSLDQQLAVYAIRINSMFDKLCEGIDGLTEEQFQSIQIPQSLLNETTYYYQLVQMTLPPPAPIVPFPETSEENTSASEEVCQPCWSEECTNANTELPLPMAADQQLDEDGPETFPDCILPGDPGTSQDECEYLESSEVQKLACCHNSVEAEPEIIFDESLPFNTNDESYSTQVPDFGFDFRDECGGAAHDDFSASQLNLNALFALSSDDAFSQNANGSSPSPSLSVSFSPSTSGDFLANSYSSSSCPVTRGPSQGRVSLLVEQFERMSTGNSQRASNDL